MQIYPYQQECLDAIEFARQAVVQQLVADTGARLRA